MRQQLHSPSVEVDVSNVDCSISSWMWNTSLFWFTLSMSISLSTVFLFVPWAWLEFSLVAQKNFLYLTSALPETCLNVLTLCTYRTEPYNSYNLIIKYGCTNTKNVIPSKLWNNHIFIICCYVLFVSKWALVAVAYNIYLSMDFCPDK